MALSIGVLRRSSKALQCAHRSLCTSLVKRQDSTSDGWFSKLLVRKIEPTKESHSRMLSDKETIFELQTHNVRCGELDKYIDNYGNYCSELEQRAAAGQLQQQLVGSWQVVVGDQDQCIHLWKYTGGFQAVDSALALHRSDQTIQKLQSERGSYLRARHCQYLLGFSFWPAPAPREGPNIYELRSYLLKPGTMIEWGNNWAKSIHYRQEDNEAFAGFFSQVGRLYNVHHIWCYQSLQHRKQVRENSWQKPGWDECVAYTVPLIQNFQSRILMPNHFSATQ